MTPCLKCDLKTQVAQFLRGWIQKVDGSQSLLQEGLAGVGGPSLGFRRSLASVCDTKP